MRRLDLATGLVTAAVGAFALYDASDLAMFGEGHVPSAGFFPKILAGLLIFLGLLLAAMSLWASAPIDDDDDDVETSRSGKIKAATVLVVYAVIAPLVELIGYIPAMILLVLVVLYGIERRRDFRSAIVAVVMPLATYYVFAHLFAIPLPNGPLLPA